MKKPLLKRWRDGEEVQMNKFTHTTEQFDRNLQREIGERIREKREERGLSVISLADKLEISDSKLYKIEAGTSPVGFRDLYWIGRHLSVSVDYLLGGEKAIGNLYIEPNSILARLDYGEWKRLMGVAEYMFPEKCSKGA